MMFNHIRIRLWFRLVLAVIALSAVFFLGTQVGNGRIGLSIFSSVHSENAALPVQLNYTSVTQVYDTLKANYDGQLTTSQLLDGLKEGLASATNDPYTEYFNQQQAQAFSNQLNNSFSGIGAELGKDTSGNLIIVSPIKGFAAYNAGLKAEDIITSINGQSTTGIATDVAANKIRGSQGTTVTLGIIRASQSMSFTVTRQNIQLPSVTSKLLAGNIGYIAISSFADDTAALTQQVAQQFKQAKVSGVILDLRGNPGGLVNAAVSVSSLWLPSGKTVVTEKGTIGGEVYQATGNSTLQGIPTVVLVDHGSASASEITAGALHDNNTAYLIGTQTYGKGVVQQLIQFKDGSELKVTIASWYRPDGQNINKKGITPDQVVTLSSADATAGNDTQLTAAEAYLTTH